MARRDQPYLPLYVQDFLTDEKLAECSAESTGVYIRLMCIMHKADPYGKITLREKDKLSGDVLDNFAVKLTRQMPYPSDVIRSALRELIDEGVLTLDGDILWQKRMVHDGELSDKRALAGRQGGYSTSAKRSAASPDGSAEDPERQENSLASRFIEILGLFPSTVALGELDEYAKQMDEDVILHAARIAVQANHRSWSYIRSILRRYLAEGRTTMASVREDEARTSKQRGEERAGRTTAKPVRGSDADARWGIKSADIG